MNRGNGGKHFHNLDLETRRKISVGRQGRKPNLGNHHSIETKKKMSDSKKGANNPNYGKMRTEATKQKLRKPKSIETIKKISASLKGRKLSNSHIQNMRNSLIRKGYT